MRLALLYGAGASIAAPARRPLFRAIRLALFEKLELSDASPAWEGLAPEALLSRLAAAGIDVDKELRGMLAGGTPNALHTVAAEALGHGHPVWTTNFDELIEDAARAMGVSFHLILPGDDPECDCGKGHLIKIHGTLSSGRVVARSEQVMLPLRARWLSRLLSDLEDAVVGIVGYAGADVDLRSGLRSALDGAQQALWFGTDEDREPLQRRFPVAARKGELTLALSERPDIAALDWATGVGLGGGVTFALREQLEQSTDAALPVATFAPNDLVRARVLDDLGHVEEARKHYRRAVWRGPDRGAALRAVYSSGLIHGAPWRKGVVTALDVACALPLSWQWPHRHRLPYLTWNLPPQERLSVLDRSLAKFDEDPELLLAAANAAKEVDPAKAVALGLHAQREALARSHPNAAAWATFVLSLAYRWLGDLEGASRQAERLADGLDALAGPGWVGWGRFEIAAIAALKGNFALAVSEMRAAAETFASIGSMFAFDAWCGVLAIVRMEPEAEAEEKEALRFARALLKSDERRGRFKREVLLVEEGELARRAGELDVAERSFAQLVDSPTAAQEALGLLGLGEVEIARGAPPRSSWRAAQRSQELGFGYGQVHAAVTLGLAGEITVQEAERRIGESPYDPPVRPRVDGLRRFCMGPLPDAHQLCFP